METTFWALCGRTQNFPGMNEVPSVAKSVLTPKQQKSFPELFIALASTIYKRSVRFYLGHELSLDPQSLKSFSSWIGAT